MRWNLTSGKLLKLIFTVWLLLWIFFLIREDKDGQYRALRYLYTHKGEEKIRFITGEELYDFLIFCRDNMPGGSAYELIGFDRLSIDKVRARYFLWPSRSVSTGQGFKIIYGERKAPVPGYKEYKRYGNTGRLLIKGD